MDVLMTFVHLKLLYKRWSTRSKDHDHTDVPTYYDLRLGRLQNLCPTHREESDDVHLGIAATGYTAQIEGYLSTLAHV
jgi:hypothetical protein